MKLLSGQEEGSDRQRLLEDQDQELSVLTRKLEMRERELAIQQEALNDKSEEQERQQTRLEETGKASSVWPFPLLFSNVNNPLQPRPSKSKRHG